MELTGEESAILEGECGEALRKTIASVVQYGAAFGAHRLVKVEDAPPRDFLWRSYTTAVGGSTAAR